MNNNRNNNDSDTNKNNNNILNNNIQSNNISIHSKDHPNFNINRNDNISIANDSSHQNSSNSAHRNFFNYQPYNHENYNINCTTSNMSHLSNVKFMKKDDGIKKEREGNYYNERFNERFERFNERLGNNVNFYINQNLNMSHNMNSAGSHSSFNTPDIKNFGNSPNNPTPFSDMFMSAETPYINPWMNKKKRKNNPLLWQYIKQHQEFYSGIMHPSKYSSLDFIQGMNKTQKMYLGSIKRMPVAEKNNTNKILPLCLNSTSILENSVQNGEFMRVSKSFYERIKDLDYENVTVQQLKNIMKEFGVKKWT